MEVSFKVDDKEFMDALDMLQDMSDAIDIKYVKSVMRRKLKPMVSRMKNASHSARLPQMIGVTAAKKKVNEFQIMKVGVVKNKVSLFPKISSYGLAAILEYGTPERFRGASKFGVVTGRVSTGKIQSGKYAFLRSSWDAEVNQFQNGTIDTIIKKIEKET